MRFIPFLILLVLPSQPAVAQDGAKLREARAAAESMITASGSLRASPSHSYTPVAWRAHARIAGTYRDHDARHRFTRHTYGWYGWYWHYSYCYPRGWYGRGWHACW